jgi:kinesin family protein C1
MSKIPRPGVACPSTDAGEMENATTNDCAPTVASSKLDQTWSPPPARPLATVDTNTKSTKPVTSTKRCVVDGEQAARNTKQKVDDDSAVPLKVEALPVTSCVEVPAGELELWQTTRQETGWEDIDCLEHKLSLPKKVDAQKKVATLGQHVKRLRALGWTLYGQRNEALSASIAAKDKVEALEAELEGTKASLEELSATLGAEVEASRVTISEQSAMLKELTARLEEVDDRLKMTEEGKSALEEEYRRVKDGLEQKLHASETAHAEGQKYTMNLQEYNSKLQKEVQGMCLRQLPHVIRRLTRISSFHPLALGMNEHLEQLRQEKAGLVEEKASLTGRVQALGDALEALQASSTKNEEARKDAVEELASLRGELASLSAERSSLSAELTVAKTTCQEQRSDLERYRAATGKDLVALEAEKANSELLSQRTKAQAETVTALRDQLNVMKEQRGAAEAQCESMCEQNRALKAKIAELEVLLPVMEDKLRDSEASRRKLHNAVLELKGNVRVFCRVRPLSKSEAENEEALALAPVASGDLSGRGLELDNSVNPQCVKSSINGKPLEQKHLFTFDRTFGPTSTQEDVFEEVSMLVQSALDGYRVCIFAYGQTGSGKTHTMIGHEGDEGIIPKSVRQVFETAKRDSERGWSFAMKAAMLEIYNEELRDLLGTSLPEGKKHTISSCDTGEAAGVDVSYLEWFNVGSSDDVERLLAKATKMRSVGCTSMNEQSSRSHMVFMLAVEGTNASTGQKLSGALNLIDLAGSERVDRSEVTGNRLKETTSINKSLSALGDVISALGNKDGHVPYRNSKLTFLLQNSLSGSGKCLMLCNVGPSGSAAPESLCTLRFAAKVNATNIGTAKKHIQ